MLTMRTDSITTYCFSNIRQPAGGVTVYLHAAPSERCNLPHKKISDFLYTSYILVIKVLSFGSNRNIVSPNKPFVFQ